MNNPKSADKLPTKNISFVGEAVHRRNCKWSNSSESRRIVRNFIFHTDKVFWLCTWMIHRLPTNCRRKLFHLWAKLHTDATINEVIPLNRAELCKSVIFFHSQIILTMHMNDSQTVDEYGNACRLLYFAITKTYWPLMSPLLENVTLPNRILV